MILGEFATRGNRSLFVRKSMSEFNFEVALSLYNSTNPFPVDFDNAWVWYEFATKSSAKRSLDSCGFIEGIDYEVIPHLTVHSDNHALLSPQEKAVLQNTKKIKLTVDCFKTWGMQIGTPKGKEVRIYFLKCEKALKERQQADSNTQLLLRVLANQEEQANFFNAQIAEMRAEMQQQNERLMLLLPDHEMMNSIREAIDDLENLKPLLEAISQSIKDNPCQPHHPLKYYLANKKCGRGLRIRIGQMVSGWLALSKGCKLDKLNGFQNRANLYPECALPLIILAWQICTA